MQRSFNLIKQVSTKEEVDLCAFNQKAWLPNQEDILGASEKMEQYCQSVRVVPISSDSSRVLWYLLVFKSFVGSSAYSLAWLTSDEMKVTVNDILKEHQPDVIHCDTLGLERYVEREYWPHLALNHHNVESHMMLRRAQKETNPLKKVYFFREAYKLRSYEKRVCPAVGINIVVSDLDKKRLLKFVPDARIMIVKNGVDISYFNSKKTQAIPHSLVFAGSMDWYPNEDAMLYFIRHIWPKIKESYRDASLTIAGRKPSQGLRKAASHDPSISVTGFVEDIRPYIDQSEVYVCPIRDGGGTKLKLLDAMAMGKAIVTTTVGAEGLEIKNKEHVLIADDPETFARMVQTLFEDKKLRFHLAQNARKFVEKRYAWEVIGKDLLEAYQLVKK